MMIDAAGADRTPQLGIATGPIGPRQIPVPEGIR